jgi:hypothetical protein
MLDYSPYEKNNHARIEQQFAATFGVITAVYPDEHFVEVKTFLGNGNLDDQHIPKCQWLDLDTEGGHVPRVNTHCIVFFIHGEPFVFGYFRPLNPSNNAQSQAEAESGRTSVQGDKVLMTKSGAMVAVRSNGSIEIQSGDTLRTIYYPTESLIDTICSTKNFAWDGGYCKHQNLNDLNETLLYQEKRRDMARSLIIVEEEGKVSEDIVRRVRIGPGIPKVRGVQIPLYELVTKITGETTLSIQPAGVDVGFKVNVLPTGSFNIQCGPQQFMLDVSPTGATVINVNKLFNLDISPTGDLSVDASQAFLRMGQGKVELGGVTGKLLDTIDQFMETVGKINDALIALTVGTGTGTSTVPINSPEFIAAKAELTKIKLLLSTFKGS